MLTDGVERTEMPMILIDSSSAVQLYCTIQYYNEIVRMSLQTYCTGQAGK